MNRTLTLSPSLCFLFYPNEKNDSPQLVKPTLRCPQERLTAFSLTAAGLKPRGERRGLKPPRVGCVSGTAAGLPLVSTEIIRREKQWFCLFFNLTQYFKSCCGDLMSDGKATDKQRLPWLLSPLEGRYPCIVYRCRSWCVQGPQVSHVVEVQQWNRGLPLPWGNQLWAALLAGPEPSRVTGSSKDCNLSRGQTPTGADSCRSLRPYPMPGAVLPALQIRRYLIPRTSITPGSAAETQQAVKPVGTPALLEFSFP